MSATRIVRRAAHSDERIRLGSPQHTPTAAAVVQGEGAAADPLQQVLEERLYYIQQMETRLAQLQQDRERLRAQLVQFEEQIAALGQAARQEGYEEGFRSGQGQAQQDLAERLKQWQATIEYGARAYESAVHALQSDLSEVVLAAIAKLLGDYAINPASVRAAVEQMLREAGVAGPARVLIAPSQYEQLMRSGSSHAAALRERRIEVAPDRRVTAGGCMIETGSGLIDGRFEIQLQRLKDLIASGANSGGSGR